MSVTNTTNKVQEAGNGVKTAFTFNFKVFQASDLRIFEIDQTTLVATLLSIATHYTVTLNTITEGGVVTYITAPVTGKDSFIKRLSVLDQQTDVDTEESIPSQSLNNEYDRSRMIDIQQQEELDRTLKFAETSSLSDVVVPESTSASARADKLLSWDAAGTALALVTKSSVLTVDPISVQGDIVQGSSLGVAEKLAIGADGSLLEAVSGKLAYVTAPTIADHTNATHTHADASQGGNNIAITDFTNSTHNHTNASQGGDDGIFVKLHTNVSGVSTDADTSEKTLMTYDLPANRLVSNGAGVRIRAWGITAGNANIKTIKLWFGATTIGNSANVLAAPNAKDWYFDATVLKSGVPLQTAVTLVSMVSVTNTGADVTAPAVDLTSIVAIKVTGQNGTASANDITCRAMQITLVK